MTPLAKRLWIALAVSVTVNLLLGGIMVGKAYRHSHRPPPDDVPALRPERGERRGALRELYREHGDELKAKRRAIAEARTTARAALEKEPFDRGALENALSTLRQETSASQEIMHRSIVGAAEKGSLEQRKDLAHELERSGPGRRGERMPGRRPKHE